MLLIAHNTYLQSHDFDCMTTSEAIETLACARIEISGPEPIRPIRRAFVGFHKGARYRATKGEEDHPHANKECQSQVDLGNEVFAPINHRYP